MIGGSRPAVGARSGLVLVGLLLLLWNGSGAAPSGPITGPGGSPETLVRGSEVYAAQCAVCHGVDGDGRGMAAHMFRVQPRNFRDGVFKFRSTPSGSLPTDADLLRTITDGIRWTGMVARADLSETDRLAVVQYLKTFSARFAEAPPPRPLTVPPAPTTGRTLLEQGRRVYRDAGCGKCHGESGRGDGPSSSGMKDDWGWPTRPSDLSWRPLKRGSSPDATYLTIATGLAGTPMPSYADSLDRHEIWALVHYLESLVPPEHRLSPVRRLGEEPRGWMALRMGRMMGRGMMHRMP